MYTIHHCRHCGDKHKKYHLSPRRMDPKRLYEKVKADIIAAGEHYYVIKTFGEPSFRDSVVYKEELAEKHKVKPSQVEDVFRILNREGMLSQAVHGAPHDSKRDRWGVGGDSAWCADHYYLCGKFWDNYFKKLTGK